jgi:hypothetical protein
MTPFDRKVRAEIYRLFAEGLVSVDAEAIARSGNLARQLVEQSLVRLEADHRIVLLPDTQRVMMAHPFSGVDTGYRAQINGRSWFANCAWDALAIVALLGDGTGRATGRDGVIDWSVVGGRVSPDGLVHLLVPAAQFWDDIGFT